MKVWDLHCDTLSELRKAEKAGQPKSFAHNDLHIDLEKLQQVLHDAALGHQVGVLVGWCFDSSHDGSPSQKSTVFLSIAQMRQLHKNAENTTALAAGG